MRTLTPAIIASLTGQQTSEVFLMLVTFTVPGTSPAEILRVSSDPTERHSLTPLIYKTVSRGDDYYFIPMTITLPNDTEGSPSAAQLSVSNVGLELISLLRSVSLPVAVTMEIVLASDPDTVGYTLPTFDLTQADWNENTVTLTLTIEALDREPFPAGNFDASGFPGLF